MAGVTLARGPPAAPDTALTALNAFLREAGLFPVETEEEIHMKAQTKALIASVVVIALALSAVSGITYSWWSDSESTDITVNTGYVDVATSDITVTQGGQPIDIQDQRTMPQTITIEYGDDAKNKSYWTSGSSATLTINGNPSKEIVISYKATFNWSVAAKYRIGIDADSALGANIGIAKEQNVDDLENGVYATPAAKQGEASYVVTITLKNGLPMKLTDAEIDIVNEITQASNPAWDGKSISTPQKNSAGEYEIGTAAELAWLADQINVQRKQFGTADTFNLTADIDLAGYRWTPIGDYANGIVFAGTFNGNNHTILGLNVQTPTGQSKYIASGLFGWAGSQGNATAEIKDIVIDGATVSGQNLVGGVVGYLQFGSISGCTVKDSVITNTYEDEERSGAKTGGIVGFIAPNGANASVTGNTVNNITLIGVRDIGCIAGLVYSGNTFEYNTVSGTNSITADSSYIYDTKDEVCVGIFYGRNSNTGSNTDISITTFTVKVGNEERLAEALQTDVPILNIILTGDIAMNTNKVNGGVLAALGGNSTSTLTIDGDGHKLTFGDGSGNPASYQSNGGGIRFINSSAKLIIENAKLSINCSSHNFQDYNILFSCDVELKKCTTHALAFHGTAVLDEVTVTSGCVLEKK